MADLTDAQIANWAGGRPDNPITSQGVRMALEIQRHRAAMKRLGAWANELDEDTLASGRSGVGPFIAAELRNRMNGAKP